MTVFGAFFGGFHSFFSIWISCLMQIIPFLLAFVIGASILRENPEPGKAEWSEIIPSAVAPFAGFIIVFTSIGMVTTAVSKMLFRYMELLNQFGGVLIGLIGLYLVGMLTLEKSRPALKALRIGFGLLLGASLAVAYKPCVTPALTVIYSFNTSPDNVVWGGLLLVLYSLGVSSAILLIGLPLAALASKAKSDKVRAGLKKGCGVLLVVVALLMLTGKMTVYKSFLVGGFVSDSGDGMSEHHHEMPHDHEMPAGHDHHEHGEEN